MKPIQDFRSDIDRLMNSCKLLTPSRETSLAYTNFQRSKMWLGKALSKTGEKTPYVNSENSSNKIIEKQSDHSDSVFYFQPEWDQTQKVKELRSICQRISDEIESFVLSTERFDAKYSLYLTQSELALEESKMWLGWELNRIKELEVTA